MFTKKIAAELVWYLISFRAEQRLFVYYRRNMLRKILTGVSVLILFFLLAVVGNSVTKSFAITQAAPSAEVAASAADTLQPQCINSPNENLPCYGVYYKDLVVRYGVKSAFDDLKARYAVDPFARTQCHQLAHLIGHAAYVTGVPLAQIFAQGDAFCWSGYYHGVMEELVGTMGSTTLSSKIDTICKDIPGAKTYSFDYYNCVHGLGHGVMAQEDGQLFDALAICGKLTGTWEQTSCAGGVFMENVMEESRGTGTAYLKTDDLMYPCDAVDAAFKSACYSMQTSHILVVVKYDFSRVFAACRSAESAYRSTCFQSLGRDASGQSVSDLAKTTATCALGQSVGEVNDCYIGAAKDFVSYYHSDVQAKRLCASAANASVKDSCLSNVSQYYTSF